MNFSITVLLTIGALMVLVCILNFKAYKYLEGKGQSPPLPFTPADTFKLISLCSKIQKETSDSTLKTLVIMIHLCYLLIALLLLGFVIF
jgi:hypothetical protein